MDKIYDKIENSGCIVKSSSILKQNTWKINDNNNINGIQCKNTDFNNQHKCHGSKMRKLVMEVEDQQQMEVYHDNDGAMMSDNDSTDNVTRNPVDENIVELNGGKVPVNKHQQSSSIDHDGDNVDENTNDNDNVMMVEQQIPFNGITIKKFHNYTNTIENNTSSTTSSSTTINSKLNKISDMDEEQKINYDNDSDNLSISRSTDNLSLSSDDNSDDNRINIITEDELSNSDDCVYAYRGHDFDYEAEMNYNFHNQLFQQNIPQNVHQPLLSHNNNNINNARERNPNDNPDDDFLEMDFDPDPPSESENYQSTTTVQHSNGVQLRIGNHHHRDDEDICIPREINKIAEVVQINTARNMLDNEMRMTASANTTNTNKYNRNTNIYQCDENKSNEKQCQNNLLYKNQNPHLPMTTSVYDDQQPCTSSSLFSSSTERSMKHLLNSNKNTGTIPKHSAKIIRNVAATTTTTIKQNDSDTPMITTNNSRVAQPISLTETISVNDICNDVDNTCLDCCKNDVLQGIFVKETRNPCERCQSNNLSSSLISNSSLTTLKNTNQIANAENGVMHTHKNLMNLCVNDSENSIDQKSNCSSLKDHHFESFYTNSVSIYTNNCTADRIVKALLEIQVIPDEEILKITLNIENDRTFISRMSLCEYLIYMSKKNCDYKRIIKAIELSCDAYHLQIEYFPIDSLHEIESETISVNCLEIVNRWTPTTNLKEIIEIKNKKFCTMNVLGKVVNIIRKHAQNHIINAESSINIPQYYKSGYILIARKSNDFY